ncbi:MAG: hypothetical protein LBC03_01470, partial [Nitrososphaerota archaeon]|nr:hypothetical protein [Nitrososphaerota archaeon]
MKQLKLFVVAIICILLISSIAATSYIILNKQKEQQKPFYVGVTYCGSSVQEAKELIDKVKNYTNLFTLQSGPLVATLTINTTAINEIGDYACAANLNYAIYTSTTVSNANWIKNWTLEAKARWGEQFIGIYYHDEPGGNMLDNGEPLSWQTTANNITTIIRKEKDGSISSNEYLVKEVNEKFLISSSSSNSYYLDGKITVFTSYYSEEITDQEYKLPPEENQLANGTIIGSYKSLTTAIDYYPNGTNTANEHIQEGTIEHYINEFFTTTKNNHEKDISTVYTSENITEYPHQILPYEEVLKQHPIQTNDKTTEFFTNMNKTRFETINKSQLQEESILVFTSDYGLYWWDYKSGYDIMLAEMGWNHTITQDIGLIRGAANLQNKSWGTILTWKYDQPP